MSPPNKVSEISDSLPTEKLTKETFLYFAYGSNMLSERLKMRCPSACLVGAAYTKGYNLVFDKKSKKDKSSKATLAKNTEAQSKVYGVVFEILKDELKDLDRAEGKGQGYEFKENFPVTLNNYNETKKTYVYIASPKALDRKLEPYDWYQALVLAGAIQHKFPDSYIKTIREVKWKKDLLACRGDRLEAICVIKNTIKEEADIEIQAELKRILKDL